MDQIIDQNLDPQAIAEFLWHQFKLEDGRALTLVLDQTAHRDNRQALVHWVRDRLACYQERGVSQPLLRLEVNLASLLIDSGLPGGELDVGIQRDEMGCVAGKIAPNRSASEARPRASASDTRIIPFPERSE